MDGVILRPEWAISSPLATMACAGLAPRRWVGFSAFGIDGPEELAVLDRDLVDGVEGAEDFFVGLEAEGAQEDGAEELALAVDADVEGVLLVVLELDPRAAVGNDLAEEVGAVVGRLKEDAGRAVELGDDDALGAVDDEGAVLGHQRNVAEEDFLLLHVAQALGAGLGVLVVDGEADGDLERGGVGHAALFALCLVVLQLQADRVAALVAEVGRVLVVGAALLAEHVAGVEGVGDDHGAAMDAGGAQVMETFEVTALALPVADGEVDEVELGDVAKIGDGKDRGKDGLQAGVVALGWELIHLEEALVGTALDFDEIGNANSGWDLRKVETAADRAVLVRHSLLLRTRKARKIRASSPGQRCTLWIAGFGWAGRLPPRSEWDQRLRRHKK